MKDRTTKIHELFSLIKAACFTKDVSLLKRYAGIGCYVFNEDDDGYIQVLAIQLVSVCYVKYFELYEHKIDTLVIIYSDVQKDCEKDFVYAQINPKLIINYRNSICYDLDEKVRKKLEHIIQRLFTVPCFSRFFYDHEEFRDDFVDELLYRKEDLSNAMKLNKQYSLMFYLDMVEYFNPYSYADQTECPTSFTVDKYKEFLDTVISGIDDVLKKDDESEIADLALNIILNVIYRDGNKEISEKAYYVLEKIVRHYCLVKKQKGLIIISNLDIILDFDLFIVLEGIAKYNNRDDKKVVSKIDDNFKKLEKDYARLQSSKANNQPKPVNTTTKKAPIRKQKKVRKEVVHSKRWGFLAVVSFIHLAIFSFLWKTFETAVTDPELNKQIVDIINSVVVKIDKGLIVSLFDSETLLKISQMFFFSGVASLVAFVLYILLSKSINTDERKGKVVLFIITLLYGIAKLPLSTLIASICIYKSKKYLEYRSKFIKFIVAIIPIIVFVLSCVYI